MADYKYLVPGSLEEALQLLVEHRGEVSVLGGGSDLIVRIRDGKESPKYLIDIAGLNLNHIKEAENEVTIGAMTPLNQIIDHAGINEHYNIVAEAAREVGGLQTRNIGTLGGNLCTGLPSADMALPLMVLDAKLKLSGLKGESEIAIDDFFIAPRQVKMAEGDLLKEIIIKRPSAEGKHGSAFIKIGKRKAMRLCILSVGISLFVNPTDSKINQIKIAMGTVAPVPLRLHKVEEFMTGKLLSDQMVEEAITIMETVIEPRTSMRATCEFRTDLARVLLKRATEKAIERACGKGGWPNC